MADYDYDSYIQELITDGTPVDRAEYVVAEAVCKHMNELAENAYQLYEQAVEERCEMEDKAYCPINRESVPQLPLELFTKNIKTNRLDLTKWNAAIQDHLLKHMPVANSTADPDKSKELLNRLSHIDRTVYSAFPLKEDVPDGRLLFAPAIPLAIWVGQAITAAIVTGIGIGIGVVVHNRRQREGQWANPTPTAPPSSDNPAPTTPGPTTPPIPVPTTPAPTTPVPTTPAPVTPTPTTPDTIEQQIKKRNDREKRQRRQTGKDDKRKSRKDYYFGYVDRIEPAGSGFEIRVEAIEENSLSDEVFIKEIQKLALAAGVPSFGRYRIAIVSIYVHSVPAGVEVGKWINFKINTKSKTLATHDRPDVSSPSFVHGITLLEPLEPSLSFLNLRIESYFADNDGYVVQTQVESITNDIAANTMSVLNSVFGAFDTVAQAIKDLLPLFMHQPTEEQGEDTGGTAPEDPTRILPAKPKVTKPKLVQPQRTTAGAIKSALFDKGDEAGQYRIYDVGQGHSGRMISDTGDEMFATDFGYGKVSPERRQLVCLHMIFRQNDVPILLSHWDSDHFRIGWSRIAKHFSGLRDDVTKRTWVAPGARHIIGPATNTFAWNIQSKKNLLQWPQATRRLEIASGNICVVSCDRNTQYSYPDKNNYGALAFVVGDMDGDQLLLYPGDANFESIPNITAYNKKIRTLVATHHGSTVALDSSDGSGMGGSIPKARTGDAHTIFSYAKGNTYGHDVKKAYPYYQQAGYNNFDATELFKPTEDSFIIEHFATNSNRLLSNAPGSDLRTVVPGILAGSIPTQPPLESAVAAAVQETPPDLTPTDGQFPSLLTLIGSGGATPAPGQDDLSDYAIRDEFGDIVIYDIIATKLILDKLPLAIPCTTDYPVTVQITCRELEIANSPPQTDGLIPLIRFEVANGPEWVVQQAEAGRNGEPGNPGYAGGRIRLAVAGSLTRSGSGANDNMSGLSLQYRGGRGSNGQKGGTGLPGTNGPNGGVVTTIAAGGTQPVRNFTTGPEPENGGDGGRGGNGGDAGAPGTIGNSEVLATAAQWPSGWKVVIDLGTPGTESEYGKAGVAGQGGPGGPGGKGSTYYFQPTVAVRPGAKPQPQPARQQMVKPSGKAGKSGTAGKAYDTAGAQFRQAKVNVKMVATEDEMLDVMAPADWRFYSE